MNHRFSVKQGGRGGGGGGLKMQGQLKPLLAEEDSQRTHTLYRKFETIIHRNETAPSVVDFYIHASGSGLYPPTIQSYLEYTVKRVDEVVQHPHLVTQDQFTQVSKKFSDIPEENFTINIELSRHFSQV